MAQLIKINTAIPNTKLHASTKIYVYNPFLNVLLFSTQSMPVQKVYEFSSRENQKGQQKSRKACHVFKHLSLLPNHISLPTSSMQLTVPHQFFTWKEKLLILL